jgi:hypothetical protein
MSMISAAFEKKNGARPSRPCLLVARSPPSPQAPTGWTVAPAEHRLALAAAGQEATRRCTIQIPALAAGGCFRLHAVADFEGKRFSRGYRVLAYPHVRTHLLYRDAVAHVEVFMVDTAPGLKVGYIMGARDAVPGASEQLGVIFTPYPAELCNDRTAGCAHPVTGPGQSTALAAREGLGAPGTCHRVPLPRRPSSAVRTCPPALLRPAPGRCRRGHPPSFHGPTANPSARRLGPVCP